MTMRPIDESAEADELYGPFMWGDVDLLEHYVTLSAQVREVVPSCTGISISMREHGATITLVAGDEQIALPEVARASGHGSSGADRAAVAAATRARGVACTLSLPMPREDGPAVGLDLYASAPRAFDGLHDELAELLGVGSREAGVDEDLHFGTRKLARRAPALLQEATDLAIVSGLLARSRELEIDDAAERLRQAAVRAAVPLATVLKLMRAVLPA